MQQKASKKKETKPVAPKKSEEKPPKQNKKSQEEDQKPHAKPEVPLDKNSKKIKKVENVQALVKKPKNRSTIDIEPESSKPEVESLTKFDEFVQAENEKYKKIRRKLISKVDLDKNLIKQAAKALCEYHKTAKEKKLDLLDNDDDFIYLEIILSEVPTSYSIRPVQIPLPVPIYNEKYTSRFAIISRDPQRDLKDKIQDMSVPCISKVIGYTKLIKNYPTYVDKRKLLYDFDLFFCDYRIYNLLRQPTGKAFYERKKIPFPIDCDNVPKFKKEECKTYEEYLNSLGNSTYFVMGNGPVYTVKVARVGMTTKEIVKNVIHGAYNTVPHILKYSVDAAKIRQLSIKTFGSVSLPVYNNLSEEELNAYFEQQ